MAGTKTEAKEKAMVDLGALLAVADQKTTDVGGAAEMSMDELLKRLAETQEALAKAEAKAAEAGKPVICTLDKTDPWATVGAEADEISDLFWIAKAMKEKTEAFYKRAEDAVMSLGIKDCPETPEVDGRFKTIWYRVGETLFRRTAVKGRRTIDTKRLFAEHPEIREEDYAKYGDAFFQKRFERTKVL